MNLNAYRALRESCAWIDLDRRGKIRATGEDRARLLHAMCTNNVQQLQPGCGCYAFFLTAQGRIIADANIFSMPDYLLIDTEPETKQLVVEHLEKYIIADDVTLHDFTDATSTIAVEGPKAESVLNELGAMPAHAQCSLVEWGHSQVAHASYTGAPGYMIFSTEEEKQNLIEQLSKAGVAQADADTVEAVRIENGRPRFGVDFTEANIPQETQLANALHFSKGCYLGQEIVERVRSRGHVNRVLTVLELESTERVAKGTKIDSDSKEVGEVTSSAVSPASGRAVALGIVRADALAPGKTLTVGGALVTATRSPATAAA